VNTCMHMCGLALYANCHVINTHQYKQYYMRTVYFTVSPPVGWLPQCPELTSSNQQPMGTAGGGQLWQAPGLKQQSLVLCASLHVYILAPLWHMKNIVCFLRKFLVEMYKEKYRVLFSIIWKARMLRPVVNMAAVEHGKKGTESWQ